MIDTNAQTDDESNLTSPDIPSRIPSVRVGFRRALDRCLRWLSLSPDSVLMHAPAAD
jgi:hypothetical protein